MNEFVEQCRSEWRRLGVPDLVADEMAAELAADLEEAAAEGAPAADVLGSGAGDPRSFAAAWAGERGVVQLPQPDGRGLSRSSRLVVAIVLFAVVSIAGGTLILTAPSGPSRLELAAPVAVPLPPRDVVPVVVKPAPTPSAEPSIRVEGRSAPGRVWVSRTGTVVESDSDDSGIETRTIGSILLTIGLAGAVPLTMLWLSTRRRTVSGRQTGAA